MSSTYYHCQWISVRPPVLRHSMGWNFPELEWPLPQQRVYRLISWSHHMPAEQVIQYHHQLRRRYPNHVVHYLCNEAREAAWLRTEGLSAHLVSNNIWVDDETFLLRDCPKKYDAVYVARYHPEKRHELAAGIEGRTLFVGYTNRDCDPPDYPDTVRDHCPNAICHGNDQEFFSQHVVRDLLQRSRVGLCLSDIEGAMKVCVEYQLCGLPVVTTRNRGGRNQFLDPEFSRTVAPDVTAVAGAVRELASLNFSPHEIRASVLRKLTKHRQRFIDLVQGIFDTNYVQHDFSRKFYGLLQADYPWWRRTDEVLAVREKDVPWQRSE